MAGGRTRKEADFYKKKLVAKIIIEIRKQTIEFVDDRWDDLRKSKGTPEWNRACRIRTDESWWQWGD